MVDFDTLRHDFPLLTRNVNNSALVYLDNAATTQKPQGVIDALSQYYTQTNANVHRGVHTLSDESTVALESSRRAIAAFLGAKEGELIITRNATEAINGVLYGWALHNLKKGDVILTSQLEHHSNFVVWQRACTLTGAELKVVPVTTEGILDYQWLESHLEGVRLMAFAHVSNALGTVLDVAKITAAAHSVGARVLLDGAQTVAHLPVNFDQLGVDFFAFSGHKLYGPMGSGGLLVRQELLEKNEMQPWLFGGGMIAEVYEDHTLFHDDPVERFTAGTPDVASTVGLAAACAYLSKIGMEKVVEHESQLIAYALEKLAQIPQIHIVGPLQNRVGSVSFLYEGVHAHDVAQILDSEGIAARSGHHCTMPLHLAHDWIATTRVSFAIYNTKAEIDALVAGLEKVSKVFNK